MEQRLLEAALVQLSRRSLSRVTRADLRAYLARRARRVRGATLSRELGVLAAFFGFLAAQGLIPKDPSVGLWTRPGGARPPILLSRASVGELLVAALVVGTGQRSPEVRRARALRNRALIELLYGLGLRASEAAALRVSDLDLCGGSLLARRVKRGKPRRLPLPRAAGEAVERYLREGRRHLVKADEDSEARLLLTERGTPLSGNEVLRIVKDVGERAGLRVHPHALRRAVASHFVQAGVSLAFVRELLGHVRLDTTQRYVVLDREDLRRAVGVLDRRLGREKTGSG